MAMIELEALEPRMLLAFKLGELPADLVADLSLARLMCVELDGLLRRGLDTAIGDTGQYFDVYSESTYRPSKLVDHR